MTRYMQNIPHFITHLQFSIKFLFLRFLKIIDFSQISFKVSLFKFPELICNLDLGEGVIRRAAAPWLRRRQGPQWPQ